MNVVIVPNLPSGYEAQNDMQPKFKSRRPVHVKMSLLRVSAFDAISIGYRYYTLSLIPDEHVAQTQIHCGYGILSRVPCLKSTTKILNTTRQTLDLRLDK